MMTPSNLAEIENGRISEVLLLGNGINRSFGGMSWTEILKQPDSSCIYSETEIQQIKSMPFPLQAVVLSGDCVDKAAYKIGEQLLDSEVGSEQINLINRIVSKGYDAILTTNYSYEIEKSLCPSFSCKRGCRCGYRHRTQVGNKSEDQYGLFRFFRIDNNDIGSIWHIHGEAALPKSIILGHYYYGKLLSYIQTYVAGTVSYYKQCVAQHRPFVPHSWIDYFLIGNVTIIGCGLDLSEMDIWWLINCKKRNFSPVNDSQIVWMEPNLNDESNFSKKILADKYGVKIITETVKGYAYRDYYKKLCFRNTEDDSCWHEK